MYSRFLTKAAVGALALGVLGVLPVSQSYAVDSDAEARLSPQGLASATCTDTSLDLTLDRPAVLGTAGRLEVRRSNGEVVDTVDLADPASSYETIGGARSDYGQLHEWRYEPVVVDGDTARVYLHHSLEPSTRYYVTVDPGFLQGFDGVEGRTAWQFRTRKLPAPGTTQLSVDAAGHGDFCTVQGAVDFVPSGNQQPMQIDVAPGHYRGTVYVAPDKPHLTIRGQDRDATVIESVNNDRMNGDTAMRDVAREQSYCPKRVLPTPDRWNCWRATLGIDADDVRLENLTVHNLTPYGGSQAEAVRGNADRIVLERVSLLSFQDTLRLQGRAFVDRSYIEGDVDFVWGTGGVFMQDSELKALHAGYYTQIRNAPGQPGNVFLRTRLTRAAGVPDGSVYLGRIETNRFPASQVAFIDSAMDAHVPAVGWQITPNDCSQAGQLQFEEYHSTDLAGRPLDVSGRLPCSRQLTDEEARQLSDPTYFLGGWDPRTH